jgi:hypothetical protein
MPAKGIVSGSCDPYQTCLLGFRERQHSVLLPHVGDSGLSPIPTYRFFFSAALTLCYDFWDLVLGDNLHCVFLLYLNRVSLVIFSSSLHYYLTTSFLFLLPPYYMPTLTPRCIIVSIVVYVIVVQYCISFIPRLIPYSQGLLGFPFTVEATALSPAFQVRMRDSMKVTSA